MYNLTQIMAYRDLQICKECPPELVNKEEITNQIRLLLNKLSEKNYDKILESIKSLNYMDPQVVQLIFKKILMEPFYTPIYVKLCKDIELLQNIIREQCIIEFNKNKNKNIAVFIGEMYNEQLIDIEPFICELISDLSETNVEVLCKIIMTINNKKSVSNTINTLNSIKQNYCSRIRFMIMDLN